ncbi:MAG TPA: RNA polymerase sigma factor [Acidimicrobiia bacterium]|nr:RNA polymerase sigma factor [Acidimicrobiia bacterium]
MSSFPERYSQRSPEDFATRLEAAKSGREWAWADLYRDLAGPVTGYLASRGATEPEDLASETFLQVARNIQTFEGDESSFRSWVFVIAHRRLLDSRRALQRRPETTTLIESTTESTGGDVEDEALDLLVSDEMKKAFEHLTDIQGDVLALRILGRLTLEETAQTLGKRVGAVKAAQRRGLIALQQWLDLEGVTR